MRSIFTFFTILCSTLLFGQHDQGINITGPMNNYTLADSASLVVNIEVTNTGVIIDDGDTLYFGWVMDGVYLDTDIAILPPGGVSVGAGGVTFPISTPKTFTGIIGGQHNLCVWFIGVGSTTLGRNFDLSLVAEGVALNGTTISDVTSDPTPLDNESCIDFMSESTLSIKSNEFSTALNIYPNPSNGTFNLTVSNDIAKFSVIDFTGKKVHEQTIDYNTNINLDNLSNGVYLFQAKNENGDIIKQEKIIIKK